MFLVLKIRGKRIAMAIKKNPNKRKRKSKKQDGGQKPTSRTHGKKGH